MSFVLYYSNYCENSKKLIESLAKSEKKNEIHFLCIDNRVTDRSGITHIIMENGQQIVLPPTVNCVPSLLLLKNGHQVVSGDEIYNILQPKKNTVSEQLNDGEPQAFQLGSSSGSTMMGVASDSFSFLDMSSEDLSAKGSGGVRQMHHYVPINENNSIQTPPDNYSSDKIGQQVTIDSIRAEREKDVPRDGRPYGSFY